MAHNSLHGGLFSGMGSGMVGLEMSLHQQQNPQNPQNPHHLQHHPQMVAAAYAHPETDHHPPQQSQQSIKHATTTTTYPFASSKPKHLSTISDEDEPGFTGGDDSTSDGKRKISPWQRMKWTDSMVRLLIMAVFYIGDEVASEGNDPTGKKKPGALLQKKGKWKSVSRAMMEKGFYVSPQQCEDKFNDLNKRYKRVNDILGKGTACRVVENQSLLDTMDLSPKMKEEVKKLLNSKHLFFREMCAYHNSCGHGPGGVAAGSNHSPSEIPADHSHIQHPHGTQQQQQGCSHSSENAQTETNSRNETEGSKMAKWISNKEDNNESSEYEDEDEDEDSEDDEALEGNSRGQNGNAHEDDDDDNQDEKPSRKRPRKESPSSMQQFNGELMSVIQDGAKSGLEKKQWMKLRLMQLEEQQVSFQCQAFELEKQRLKWVKFSSKKEREMERAKLENERQRLENERMVLMVQQKELELHDLHRQQKQQQQQLSSNKNASSITG